MEAGIWYKDEGREGGGLCLSVSSMPGEGRPVLESGSRRGK